MQKLCLLLCLFVMLLYSCSDEGKLNRPVAPIKIPQQIMPIYETSFNDEYIVTFRDSAFRKADILFEQGEIIHTYSRLHGYHAKLSKERLSTIVQKPEVAYVEQNQKFHINIVQPNATWGIDRIDSRKGLDNTYTYTDTGAGVTAYVIDTGVESTNSELLGRVGQGYSAVGGTPEDCNGHGTHVAGTIAGTTYGVAKAANIVSVRVLDCNGSGDTAGILDGLNWLLANVKKPAVANMSLGGEKSQSLDDGITKAIAGGITFSVAAGNESQDACNTSPADIPEAITVAATNQMDAMASFSNYGPCVKILAPGVNITSAKMGGGNTTMSGTSMASPHVAGTAALFLQRKPGASPAEIWKYMKNLATTNAISNVQGTANLFLYTDPNNSDNPTPTPTPTPTPIPPNPNPNPNPIPPAPAPVPQPQPIPPYQGTPDFCKYMKCTVYVGQLIGNMATTIPKVRPFFARQAIEGKLIAPAGFQLLLWQSFNPYSRIWNLLQVSDSEISASVTPGFYAWVVVSNGAFGKYHFWYAGS